MELEKLSENIDTSNIFDELNNGGCISKENPIESNKMKDKWYYIGITGKFFQGIFIFLFVISLTTYSYVFIQQNENMSISQILDPICFLFLGDLKNNTEFCASISSLHAQYEKKLENIKQTQTKDILSILEPLYRVENFGKTKELVFLETQSSSKLKVLDILEAFDDMKNIFEPVEKEKIKCYDIEVDEKQFLSARCEAYSAGFENEIKGFDGTDDSLLKGTSISIANSFLNFIEKTSKTFSIVDRQKIFASENIVGENTGFTNKTVFYIKLKYKSNNLSL